MERRSQEVIEMQEGLLWLDVDPKADLAEKVDRAADRYLFKFGRRPNLCYVNAAAMGQASAELNGVRVLPAVNVLKHHFWIGVEEGAGEQGGLCTQGVGATTRDRPYRTHKRSYQS